MKNLRKLTDVATFIIFISYLNYYFLLNQLFIFCVNNYKIINVCSQKTNIELIEVSCKNKGEKYFILCFRLYN